MRITEVGVEVWAYAFRAAKTNACMSVSQKPIQGVLSGTNYEDSEMFDSRRYSPHYFIPYKKNSKELNFKKAVSYQSREYAYTEQEAIDKYNECVERAMRKLQDLYDREIEKMRNAKI